VAQPGACVDAGARPRHPDAGVIVSLLAAVDVLIAAAWIGLAADNLRRSWRERDARARLPPAVSGPRASRAARLGATAVLIAGGLLLERRTGGRLAFHPLAASIGIGLTAAGLALHARARRALGVLWSSAIIARPGLPFVSGGPYAVVRHPIYLGVLLLAAGTLLAHPSVATICIAVGLTVGIAVKIPAEERTLRSAYGESWTRYAASVPALIPRPSRLRALVTRAAP
jgi:protein-S-isoprenylcysteine O-methyltransferase Ste14